MDTSETYVKMCEKAEEIQEDWKPTVGDYICIKSGEKFVDNMLATVRIIAPPVYIIDSAVKLKQSNEYIKSRHWLIPRQDQLQEMIHYNPHDSLILFLKWYTFAYQQYPKILSSMEQLWLAFLLAEKYGKHWNGSDWVLQE